MPVIAQLTEVMIFTMQQGNLACILLSPKQTSISNHRNRSIELKVVK